MRYYAGLDLTMEETQVCIVEESGARLLQSKISSDPAAISEALAHVGTMERAVIESRRMMPAICHGLTALGINVICIQAHQAHQSLKAMNANKTDPNDAAGFAQLARTGFLQGSSCEVSGPSRRQIRDQGARSTGRNPGPSLRLRERAKAQVTTPRNH